MTLGADGEAEDARRAAGRDRRMQWFYYSHAVPLVAIAFLLDFEMFTKVSLLYTTTVSAITAGATYGAKGKAERAEATGYDGGRGGA